MLKYNIIAKRIKQPYIFDKIRYKSMLKFDIITKEITSLIILRICR